MTTDATRNRMRIEGTPQRQNIFQRIKQGFRQSPQQQPRLLTQEEINEILNRPQQSIQPQRQNILNAHQTTNLFRGQRRQFQEQPRQFQPQRNVADVRGNTLTLCQGQPLASRLKVW